LGLGVYADWRISGRQHESRRTQEQDPLAKLPLRGENPRGVFKSEHVSLWSSTGCVGAAWPVMERTEDLVGRGGGRGLMDSED
jgi:hypothetical protein